MTKSLSEFKRFVAKTAPTLSDDEKKLANLILERFGEISAVGSAAGRRGKVVARAIVERGDAASSEIEEAADGVNTNESSILQLTKLEVENFRGFSDKQTFEFKTPYTFIYGPNGTGKSSLCEALEYALLGSINEAESKRIPLAEYIKNATSRKTVKPVLYGDTATEKGIEVKSDTRNFEFCFIEKNRIDGFARVSANTPVAQQARLAALFGLEEFNAFATQFNESLEPYLDLVGRKGAELVNRAKSLAGHQAVIDGLPDKAKVAEARRAALLSKHAVCGSLDDIKASLVGPDGNGGKQKDNHAQIVQLQNIKAVSDPEIDKLLNEAEGLLLLIKEDAELSEFLNQYKRELSLRDLYSSLLANRDQFGNECPACASQLYRDGELAVPVDPYRNAEDKLAQFDRALAAEARINEIDRELRLRWQNLQTKIAKLPVAASDVGLIQVAEVIAFNDEAEGIEGLNGVAPFLQSMTSRRELLQALTGATTAHNEKVGQSRATIEVLEQDNIAIARDLEEIVAISTLEIANANSRADAAQAIERFNAENEDLIRESEAEKLEIERSHRYSEAYSSLREKLLAYNAALPLTLAADLNEATLRFYNEINKNDHPSDTLKSLQLPTAAGDRIQIEFCNGDVCDALQVLSEGHIRCLGLAILLAKITTDRLPFLIFDDVVNSIDDEHRSAIIDLILDADEVGKRQLIITTHGEDFVKRLENAVPLKRYQATVTRIDFLVPIAAKKIAVKLDSPRHYLAVASQSFADGRMRDSLSYLRKAFEDELNQLWKKIASKRLAAQLSVGMRAPGDPDLMSLATGLHQLLSRNDVAVYQEVLPYLSEILSHGQKHKIEWNSMNKGTHEEDRVEEFDPVIVRQMLECIANLDQAMETA